MEEISQLIDLTFFHNKSINTKLLSESLITLNNRISYSYNSEKLLYSLEVCGKVAANCDWASNCIHKLNIILQNRAEIKNNEEYIQIVDIFNTYKGMHKSLLTIRFKMINTEFSQENNSFEFI